MRATDILKAIQTLNPAEKHRLREYLIDALTASSSTGTALEEISERKHKDGYHCPDCESEHIVRFGKYATIVDGEEVKKQRYRCKACRMTFTDLTNTALYRTRHLHRWMKFIECMIEGYSLRKAAKLVGGRYSRNLVLLEAQDSFGIKTDGKFNIPGYRRNGRDLFPVLGKGAKEDCR